MISVVPCKRSHLEAMQGHTIEEATANPSDLSASVSIIDYDDVGIKGIVLGAGGFVYKEKGKFYVWSVLTPECVEHHKVTLHKVGKGFMDEVAPQLRIKELTAFVLAGFTTGIEWAEVFGFECKEHVEDYTSGERREYVKMVRLWD